MEAMSGVLGELVSLPEGGGELGGLGDRFEPDLLTGTGNYSIPLELPEAPLGPTPELSLTYSTGRGNGVLGMGWAIAGPIAIDRRTDDGVPTYDGDDEFVLEDSVLVHVGDDQYRPRVDDEGWDVRRREGGWIVRTGEGDRYMLGTSADARVTDANGDRVSSWLLEAYTDPTGASVTYEYEFDANAAYCSSVSWGIYELRFEYEPRPDGCYDGRAGYLVRTDRRCSAIELRSDELDRPTIARWTFTYEPADGSGISLLTSVTKVGFGPDGETESYPSITLSYVGHDPEDARYERVESVDGLPSLADPSTTLIDLTGDGLPDLLETGPDGHWYWPNRGDGSFGPRRSMPLGPAGMELGRRGVSLGDLDGDGAVDLFRVHRGIGTTVRNAADGSWVERPVVYAQTVPLGLSATDSRLVDLDGDGEVDLLQSGPGGYLLSYNLGGEGWSRPQAVSRYGEAGLPEVDLDSTAVELADVTGDGLTDVVRVESGRIEYWPSLGHGVWDDPVRMSNPPRLPRGFDRDRLFLVDLDRDGTADLLYVDHDRVCYWFNRAGSGWSDRFEVPFVPPPDVESLHLADLDGSGTRGLVWSERDRRTGSGTGYRHVSLGGDPTPYLLTEIEDGAGLRTEIEYTTTAAVRAEDRAVGDDWGSYLPFPLQVVDAYVETDATTGRTRRTELRYHRGHYDADAGEFQGFEQVELVIQGDEFAPTVVQETTFEHGDPVRPGTSDGHAPEARAASRAVVGRPTSTATYEVDDNGARVLTERAELTHRARLAVAAADGYVHIPELRRTEARTVGSDGPDRIDVATYEYDEYSNVTRRIHRSRFADESDDEAIVTDQRVTYVENEAAWLVGLPTSVTVRDADGNLHSHTRTFYDGDAFEGLPAGEATRGLVTRERELVLADWALPDGYADEIDPSWGLHHEGEGYYRDASAIDRDESGATVAIRDPLGVEHHVEYDDESFPRRLTRAAGTNEEAVVVATFDRRTGQPASIELPDGTVVRNEYSPLGRLRATYETAGDGNVELTGAFAVDFADPFADPPRPPHVTSYEPRVAGRTAEELLEADPASLSGVDVARDFYDGMGNRVQEVRTGSDDANGSARWVAAQRTEYTVRGEPAVEYPNAFVDSLAYHSDLPTDGGTTYRYDGADAVERVERPDGERIRIDRYPDRIEAWEPGVSDAERPSVERLDARGNLVGVERPIGDGDVAVTTYDLDLEGRLVEVTDASGRVSATYTYVGPGDPVRIEHADAGRRTYWHDAAENRRLRTDSLGRRLSMRYDRHGRLVEAVDESDPDEPRTVRSHTYEGSLLVESVDGDVILTFGYDATGRWTAKTVDAGDGDPLTLEREFTLQGDLASLTYPDGTRVAYAYGDDRSPVGALGFVDDVRYDAHDRPVAIEFAGDASTHYAYDEVDQGMTEAALWDGDGSVLRSIEYEYDARGNVTTISDSLPSDALDRRFEYDRCHRLLATELDDGAGGGAPDRRDEYDYTPTGDLRRTDESGASFEYGDPDHAGRLTEVTKGDGSAPTTLAYDDAGRLKSYDDLESIEYDVWDRVVAVERADGTVVRFAYDAGGTRVSKRVDDGETVRRTTYVDNRYEVGPDGEQLSIRLGELLVAVRTTPAEGDPRTAFLLADHVGSVVAACDETGTLVHQQVYSPFGRPLQGPAELNRYNGFDGDAEVGLVQFGDRYYAPELGRFITPDWFVIEGPERAMRLPQALNAYSYAINNPVRFRDPTGKFVFLTIGIAAAVGFVGGTIYGLATGESVGRSLLRGLEAGLLGGIGAALGAVAGLALGGGLLLLGSVVSVGVLTSSMMAVFVGVGAVVGGLNGVISGATGIYNWRNPSGYAAFLADSTWGLAGTTLGIGVHLINWTVYGGGEYNREMSERKNAHVYDGGVNVTGNFAFTQGNVISHLDGRHTKLYRHERLHVNQNRIFGPVYLGTFAIWLAVGAIVGAAATPFNDQSLSDNVMDMAYYNNPWETWAYTHADQDPDTGSLSWL